MTLTHPHGRIDRVGLAVAIEYLSPAFDEVYRLAIGHRHAKRHPFLAALHGMPDRFDHAIEPGAVHRADRQGVGNPVAETASDIGYRF